MLGRYRIVRGKRPPDDPLPKGIRQDTRKHTHHFLRPSEEIVSEYLADPTSAAWKRFEREYRKLIAERFKEDRRPFDELAELASREDVWLGCNCPTERNPDVHHCHTVVALDFMKKRYPKLKVRFP
ncbi:MAG TPA: DUF488 family protein [Planctomycetota bacterium]|nr:DUF488 family protein [Planctomycetota bacterium]